MNRHFSKSFSRSRSLLVSEFKPRSYQEEQILEFAREVGEQSVATIKSYYDRYDKDFYVIPIAYQRLQERIAAGTKIHNKAAYLNSLIRQLLEERRGGGINEI